MGRSRQPAAQPAWGRTARRAVQRAQRRAPAHIGITAHQGTSVRRDREFQAQAGELRSEPAGGAQVETGRVSNHLGWRLAAFGWTPRDDGATKIHAEHARRRCAIAGRRPRAGKGGNVTAAAVTGTPRGAPALLPDDRDERNSARQHEASEDPRRRQRPCACERNARCDQRRAQAARGAACTDARRRTCTCRRRGHGGAQARERRAGMRAESAHEPSSTCELDHTRF